MSGPTLTHCVDRTQGQNGARSSPWAARRLGLAGRSLVGRTPGHWLAGLAIALFASGCGNEGGSGHRAVYMLLDTSGTYAKEIDKAQTIVNWLIGTLNPGDTFALARISSRSFNEKDIIARATFTKDPMEVNRQKKMLRDELSNLRSLTKHSSAYTDITGGLLQATQYLAETGAGRRTILIFSDMEEDLDAHVKRDTPLNLKGVRVVGLNVIKLASDNVDPARYINRVKAWEKRFMAGGATSWKVVNDLEHMERIFRD
jgi:hypothetical protein